MHTSSSKVSVVDDDIYVRASYEQIIRQEQDLHLVGSHDSAECALSKLPMENPDVVLLDLLLPGMSGFDCLRHLRAICRPWKIIIVTACTDMIAMIRSVQLGADGFLTKPFLKDHLIGSIRFSLIGGYPLSHAIIQKMQEFGLRNYGSECILSVLIQDALRQNSKSCDSEPFLGAVALASRYHVQGLAQICQLSTRQLERYFNNHLGESPRTWLRKMQMKEAPRLLASGFSLKQVTDQLGYAHSTNFYPQYRRFFRHHPRP